MDTAATKKCPFCAEEIKAEAIKCRFCGEMLDGSGSSGATSGRPVHETKVFVIPFPDGSPPTTIVWQFGKDEPFPDSYLRAIGYLNKKTPAFMRRSYQSGITKTWNAYKDYFLERVNELGREGWQLAEAFEHPVDEGGRLARPADRFEVEMFEEPGLFGKVKRRRFLGARFLMRRTTFE